MKRITFIHHLAATAAVLFLAACDKKGTSSGGDGPPVLRIGFFPNITHAQGLIGYHQTQTSGSEGFFEKATGAKIEWYPFNAGPSAIESLLAGTIDATYVGPNPVLNGYIRTKGANIRVLSGAARGGVALVIQPGSGLKTAADFRGKKIATPQLGNTQDVAARAWLKAGGLDIRQGGGDAFVIPTQNPDQLDLFKRKDLDAVWTVEPWVSRLEMEGGAERLLSQDDTFITLLATSTRALGAKAALLRKFVAAHEQLTVRVASDVAFAKPAITAALKKATGKEIPAALFDHAWPRLKFKTALKREDFETAMHDARSVGLLPEEADLANLFAKP
jgi:NitT/TauT family transport system substrate-binding protein